jgi:3-methylcrotonyl-CoA carboxylase alpha subunit
MRIVESPDELAAALESGRREADRAFGNGRLLLERAIEGARHVEVQVLADSFGHIVHLGERDCSVQRRHQKVIEETPSPAVDENLRDRMGEAAIRIAKAVGYESAGTVELLLGEDGEFYFLEMNTRLQVEHGVTELVTGLDLVALQLAIAAGEPLPFDQNGVTFSGHAVECRVYAEDPLKGYLPSPGRITRFHLPTGDGIRNDAGTYEGDEISTYYDPLIGKVLAWGSDRPEAIRRMERALAEYRVDGVHTNLALLRAVSGHPQFRAGNATTDFLESRLSPEALVSAAAEEALISACGALVLGVGARDDPWSAMGPQRAGGHLYITLLHEGTSQAVEAQRIAGTAEEWFTRVSGRERRVRFTSAGPQGVLSETDDGAWAARVGRTSSALEVTMASGRTYPFQWSAGEHHAKATESHRKGGLSAPMPGLVLKVLVRPGDKVRAHQTLIVLEAMKMEHNIEAPYAGTVKSVNCAEGGRVAEGVVLIELEPEAS